MPTLTVNYETPEELRDYERAIAFVAEMRQLGMKAPAGEVIDACEGMALSQGQDFLRATLAAAVQSRIGDVEKKSRRPAGMKPLAREKGRGRS